MVFSRRKLEQLVNTRFAAILQHASKNVPYYRKWMQKGWITSHEVLDPKTLSAFPIVTKEQLRERQPTSLPKLPHIGADYDQHQRNNRQDSWNRVLIMKLAEVWVCVF